MALPDFTEADILRWFGPRELKKAQSYVHLVTRLAVSADTLTARVAGTAPLPYEVDIRFSPDLTGTPKISPFCSCPVGWHCKHAAAVLLAWLQQHKQPERVNPEVLSWLEDFRRAPAKTAGKSASKRDTLLYCVVPHAGRGLRVHFFKARLDNAGRALKLDDWNSVERAITNPPSFVQEEDLTILPLLWAQRDRQAYVDSFPLWGDKGEAALQRMLASDRLFFAGDELLPLHAAPNRPAVLQWHTDAAQRTRANLSVTPPASVVLVLERPWYIDGETGATGVLECAHPTAQITRLLELPPLTALDVPVVSGALAELAPDLPRPQVVSSLRVIETPPLPQLALDSLQTFGMARYRDYPYAYQPLLFDYATVHFRYDTFSFAPGDPTEFATTPDGEAVRVRRDSRREAEYLKQLDAAGFSVIPSHVLVNARKQPEPLFGLESETAWPTFMAAELPALRDSGWAVQIPADFRHHVLEAQAWEAEFHDEGNGWLALDLGVVLEGQRLALAPLLYDLFQRDSRWLDAARLKKIRDSEAIALRTPEGLRFSAPAGRLKPLARTLIDLFDVRPEGALRVSRLDAPRLAEIAEHKQWQATGGEAVVKLARQLQRHGGVKTVSPPTGLGLKLRP